MSAYLRCGVVLMLGLATARCDGEAGDIDPLDQTQGAIKPTCGDNRCGGRESCGTCPQDCGRCAAQRLLKVSGDRQTGAAGTELAMPLVVQVTDDRGNVSVGSTVSFALAAGSSGTLSAATAVTDAQGRAQVKLTLGAAVGDTTVNATVGALAVSFVETVKSGAPAAIASVSGDGQTGVGGSALLPFVVRVADAANNPVAGAAVTFAIASGDGKLSVASATSDLEGKAQSVLTLGLPGTVTVTATATGLAPITFTATATAPVASKLLLVSGDLQSAPLGSALPAPLVVKVTDASGLPVAGTAVSFAVASGGGTLSAASATSGADGLAQTTLTLGTSLGAVTVTASAPGLTGSPLTFTATATAGAASALALVSGNNQSAPSGSMLQPFVVSVKDAAGNPVAGFTVLFAIASGGGALSSASATTAANGQAQTVLTLSAAAGVSTVTASAAGLSGSPLLFTATGVAGAASALALVSGNNQSARVGTALGAPLVAAVKDANGNPVSGVTVSFAVASGGGSVSPASAVSAANGQVSTSLTVGPNVGANTVTATAAGLPALTFTASGVAGTASQLALVSGNAQTGTAGSALAAPLVVSVKDMNGNPISGFAITFAVGSGGGSLSVTSATTGSTGQAQTTLTLGRTAGANTVTASGAGLTGSPLSFTATGTAGAASRLALVSGSGQSGAAGTTLPQPFVVAVTDANGNAVSGTTVAFAVTAGGGTVTPASAASGANGQAQTVLKLGTTAGANSVTASVSGLTGSPLTFTATATAGAAASLAAVSGNNQTAAAGATLAPFVVLVKDLGGNPVAGVTVAFAVTAGGGRLSSASAASGANGQASTTLTLGSGVGANTVTASVAGLAGSPLTFTATATTGSASQVAIVSGNNQRAAYGTALGAPLVVSVKDAGGNLVSGATVAFAVTAGGGRLSATSAVSDASGQAKVSLTLGPAAGANTVTASLPGVSAATVTFTAQGVLLTFSTDVQPLLNARCVVCHAPGGASSFTPLTNYAEVRYGVSFFSGGALVVPGNPAGSMLGAKTSSSGSMYNNLGVDDPSRAAGSKLIFDWISQGAFNTAVGTASQIALVSGNGQSGTAGAALPLPLVVLVRDANLNPVSGYNVTFAVTAGGGSLSAATRATDAEGHASVVFTLGPTAGTQSVSASGSGLSGSPLLFTATASAGAYSGAPLAGSTNPFDVAALTALRAANIEPVQLSGDGEFLRRVTADLAGRLPTDAEWSSFIADTDPLKREKKIDALLASTDYVTHWGGDLLPAWLCVDKTAEDITATDLTTIETYLRDAVTADKSLATLAQELSAGTGAAAASVDVINLHSGRRYQMADRLMETFTGIPSRCSRCHDSKITTTTDDPKWTRAQNGGLYKFFEESAGQVTSSSYPFAFVVDGVATNPTGLPSFSDSLATRRARFGTYLTGSKAFARGTAHRIYAELMDPLLNPNRILAQPLSEVRTPEVLTAASNTLVAQGFSLKKYLRVLATSKLYQLTSKGTSTTNDKLLARHTARRELAEVVQRGIVAVTGIADSTGDRDAILSSFGFPMERRAITERTMTLNTLQPLTLLNKLASVPGKVTNTASKIATLAASVDANTITLDEAIKRLYRGAIAREPTATELTALKNELSTATTNKEKLEDVAAVLMASVEFQLR